MPLRPPLIFLALALAASIHAAPTTPSTVNRPKATVHSPASTVERRPSAAPGPELNLRTLGAIGDGQPHPVSEWIAAKRYKNLGDIQRDYPFVTSLDWSADEAAFQRALRELPPEGGTIRIPPGRYVATAYGWRIERDHVRLIGAGMRDTMLSTGPKLDEGLVLAPYRHVGWLTGVDKEYPFTSDSGAADTATLRLREPTQVADFKPGELVFIRNGACRFDQDYGEFNEIKATTPDGDLVFVHPLSRDYTRPSFNWANETAEPFTLPKPGKTVTIRAKTGNGFFELPKAGALTVGEALLEIVRRDGETVTLRNPVLRAPSEGESSNGGVARDALQVMPIREEAQSTTGVASDAPTSATRSLGFNPPPGTVLPAGTKIGKSRSVIKVTRTTRDFRAEGLRVFGRRKALNLSNSYRSFFLDCDFVHRPDTTAASGGLTIDGDGGRFAEFRRCTIRGTVPCGMQFARSFGSITFTDCTFTNTNVVFSEFCFAATVQSNRLHVPSSLGSAFIVGRSCGDLIIEDNHIVVTGGALTVFDATTDIASQKLDAPGRLVLRDNRIVAAGKPRIYLLRSDRPAEISGNTLNNEPVDPPATAMP